MDVPTIPGTDTIDLETLLTPERRAVFESAMKSASDELEISAEALAEIRKVGKQNNKTPVLPQAITLASGNTIKSLYGSPFPDDCLHLKSVHICDYCLEFFGSMTMLTKHLGSGCSKGPPGEEIYRKGNISIFEVNGHRQRNYCRNLCLLSRLFLESKTVFYDTEHFMFYVLAVHDERGHKFAGYFSKEMYWPPAFTMMCLMVLPTHQSKGFGRILIALSYAMARREKIYTGPEEPLSDGGKHAHEQYWIWAIAEFLYREETQTAFNAIGLSINQIGEATGINSHDVLRMMGEQKWAEPGSPVGNGTHKVAFTIDWDHVTFIVESEKIREREGRDIFDETCLDWQVQKITPQMNGFDNFIGNRRRIPNAQAKSQPQKSNIKLPVDHVDSESEVESEPEEQVVAASVPEKKKKPKTRRKKRLTIRKR